MLANEFLRELAGFALFSVKTLRWKCEIILNCSSRLIFIAGITNNRTGIPIPIPDPNKIGEKLPRLSEQ